MAQAANAVIDTMVMTPPGTGPTTVTLTKYGDGSIGWTNADSHVVRSWDKQVIDMWDTFFANKGV